jgi:CheY-like chemotaxis protein
VPAFAPLYARPFRKNRRNRLSKEPCKVLVADEDRHDADTAVMLLQMWGHEAEAAYSPEDALSKARALDPDVILIDLERSVRNSIDLAKELRQCCPDVKLVALAGFTADDIVRRTREAGFRQVLVKPTPASRLKEAVDTECAAAPSEA